MEEGRYDETARTLNEYALVNAFYRNMNADA